MVEKRRVMTSKNEELYQRAVARRQSKATEQSGCESQAESESEGDGISLAAQRDGATSVGAVSEAVVEGQHGVDVAARTGAADGALKSKESHHDHMHRAGEKQHHNTANKGGKVAAKKGDQKVQNRSGAKKSEDDRTGRGREEAREKRTPRARSFGGGVYDQR